MSARHLPDATILRLSARELIAGIPEGSIDVLVTDPPYTSVERNPTSGHLRDWFAGGLSWPEIGRVLRSFRPKLKPSGAAFVMTNAAGLADAIVALEAAGFRDVRPITWDKRSPGLGGGLRHQTEFVLVGRLSGARPLTGVDLVSVPAVGPAKTDRYPTEKPAELGRALAEIAGVGRGDVVLGPFCGSGALLAGARERGAVVIGGDISARAVARATERLVGRPARSSPVRRMPARTSLDGRRCGAAPADRNSARADRRRRAVR